MRFSIALVAALSLVFLAPASAQQIKGKQIAPGFAGLTSPNTFTALSTFSVNPQLSACVGYVQSNGTTPVSCAATIPASNVTGTFAGSQLAAGAAATNLGLSSFSRSGNTFVFATIAGSLTSGHCLQSDSNGNLMDSGAGCGTGGGGTGGGTVNNGGANTLAYYPAAGTAVSALSLGTGVLSALSTTPTGSGTLVLATSPALTTPNLGTPSAVVLTNATGMPVSGLVGGGTSVLAALANPTNVANGLAVFNTSGGLTIPGGNLASLNLLLQGDGTNAYIRPTNTGSLLYLGAGSTNVADFNSVGLGFGTSSQTVPLSFGTGYVGTAGTANILRLYDNGAAPYGFGVSSGQLDIVSGGNTAFWSGSTQTASLSASGLSLLSGSFTGNSAGLVYASSGTGAVARNLNNKLGDVFNILDFGADPTHTTDSSAAIQAALNANCARSASSAGYAGAGGGVYAPPGFYLAHDLVSNCPVEFYGEFANYAGWGTVFDYTASTYNFFYVQPPAWPAVPTGARVEGAYVHDFSITNTNASNTSTGISLIGTFNGRIENIAAMQDVYNFVSLYGDYNTHVRNVSSLYVAGNRSGASSSPWNGVTNNILSIFGDLNGQNSQGGSCSLGDCSTRTDVVWFEDSSFEGNAGVGVYISGMAYSIHMTSDFFENRAVTVQSQCPTGFANISYCPNDIHMDRVEGEGFTNYGYYLSDTTGVIAHANYLWGNGAGANNAVKIVSTNYAFNIAGDTNFTWDTGRIGNTGGSLIYSAAGDLRVVNGDMISGNLSNIGASAIQIVSSAKAIVTGNTFCNPGASSGGSAMAAIVATSGSSYVNYANNNDEGCVNASSLSAASPSFYATIGADNNYRMRFVGGTFYINDDVSSVLNLNAANNAGILLANQSISIDTGHNLRVNQLNDGARFYDTNLGTAGSTAACWSGSSGSVWIGACSSDETLKTNIGALDADGALARVVALDTHLYNWRHNPSDQPEPGFLAQDVKKLFPLAVERNSDGHYVFSPDKLVPYLFEAIRAQQREILLLWVAVAVNGVAVLALGIFVYRFSRRITSGD